MHRNVCNVDAKLRRSVQKELGQVTPIPRFPAGERTEHKWREIEEPSLLMFTLRDVLGLEFQDEPGDKTRWAVSFSFVGAPYALELRKYGLTVITTPEHPKGSKLTNELHARLGRAVRFVGRALDAFAGDQAERGAVTAANKFDCLDAHYRFFRASAEQHYADGQAEEATQLRGIEKGSPQVPEEIGAAVQRIATAYEHAGFFATAAVNAYFSRTEHLFVLALPFSNFDPASNGLIEFLGMNWTMKVKVLLDLKNPATNDLHRRLKRVRDMVRNPMAHGGFLSGRESLYFHLPSVGALPVRVTRRRDGLHLSFDNVGLRSFGEMCAAFDAFDEHLERGSLRYAVRWAKAGLDVFFDADSRLKYRAAMASSEMFDRFLDGCAQLEDRRNNFEE
jgi:hypothetical protein